MNLPTITVVGRDLEIGDAIVTSRGMLKIVGERPWEHRTAGCNYRLFDTEQTHDGVCRRGEGAYRTDAAFVIVPRTDHR